MANGVTADLLARMEMDVSTAGNAYVRRMPNRLHLLPPEYVHILLGSQEDAEHPWEGARRRGRRVRLPPAERQAPSCST